MFQNHLKIAWRHLWKDRRFTLLNLIGLSSGLACVLLIYLWVNDELQVDRFNANDKLLYQVMKNDPDQSGIQTSEHTPGLLGASLSAEMPEVAYAATVVPASWFNTEGLLTAGDVHIRSDEQYVSKDFFKMFAVKLLSGSPAVVLPDPYAVAISDQLALKVFHGTNNVVGKTINWNMEGLGTDLGGTFHITAVYKSLPSTSSLKSDLLFNYDLFLKSRPNLQKWGNSDPNTYVLLKQVSDAQKLNTRLHDLLAGKLGVSKGSKDYADMPTLFIQRFSDRYLHGKYDNGHVSGGRIQYVNLFSVVAVFILLIACINFMNLSTAKASRRLKEVGIKKVIGATRINIMFQYFTESVFTAFLSLLFAMLLVILLLPQFNEITGKQLDFQFARGSILTVVIITLLTGIVSGSYPAIHLSGFKPVRVLAGKLPTSWSELWVRKGLVVFQFSLSVVFIIAVLVVYRQMDLLQNKDLGYKRENVITFKKEGGLKTNLQGFLTEVRNTPGVDGASSSLGDLTGKHGSTTELLWKGKKPDLQAEFSGMYVDYDWIETLGLKVLEGRSFAIDYGSDSTAVIFNESAIKAMGMHNPIGQRVMLFGKFKTIVGVVKDFNFESLYQEVKPCFITLFQQGVNIEVKIRGGAEQTTLAKLDGLYKKYNPGVPFDYRFLDSNYQALYVAEQRVAVLSKYFAGLAVIISCLGLFGLAAFTARRKQKEIGIRKVVGAGTTHIVMLLSKEFIALVGIAILLAFPISWLIATKWLDSFAYRVPLGTGLFLAAGSVTILIACLTVSYQALRAALVNPASSIRD